MRQIFILMIIGILNGCEGTPLPNLGVQNGQFAPCPDSPNCVSSQSASEKHFVAPLLFSGAADSARRNLVSLIKKMPRTKVATETESYIHAEFTIAVMGFVDDVEFYFDDANKIIHVRSASRIGYWDLGVNRRRVEKIRKLWEAQQKWIDGVLE
jgi:uncharacterized protein (DUF1499 family)